MSGALTCQSCGVTFTLPADVAARYPGWQPASCRRCHQKGARGGGARGAGRSGGGSAGRSTAGAGRRPAGGSAAGTAPRTADRTVAEVLARYDGGPTDGVFTDGSAQPNPGPGGWGAVYVVANEIVDEAWGHEPETTNNRMELTALIAGYDLVPKGTPATVYTDSRLAVDTITKWAPGWARRGWTRKTGPVENLDLVRALYERALARPELTLTWIRAHAGARWNEYADALSTAYRRTQR